MANIRREVGRHDWIHPLTLHQGDSKVPNSSKCRNCAKEIYGREPTETGGCPFELKVSNFTQSKMRDLRNYEMDQNHKAQQDEYAFLRRAGQMDDQGNIR